MTRKFPFTIRQVAKILDLRIRYDNPDSGNMDTDCPFCQKESKMNLNVAKNVYRCNNCGDNGGMVQMYAKIYDISNSDAYQEICEILGCSKKMSADNGNPELSNASTPTGRANSNIIHQTYSMLLSMLSLANPHKKQLFGRGLSQEQIAEFSYKSVPAFGQKGLCAKLLKSGCTLDGVPGFYKENGVWNVKLKAPGIIIPVCGIDGKILGMQIRLDKPINGRAYIWFSSADLDNGTSSGAPIHFIGDPTAKRIYVTDGALKGTVSHVLTGYTFVCLPGTKCLGGLDNLLECLKANGATEAIEAFNINKLTNKEAGEVAAKLREKLYAHGFKVTSAVWSDTFHNAVDDYFLHRMEEKKRKNQVHSVVLAPPKPLSAIVSDLLPVRNVDIATTVAV